MRKWVLRGNSEKRTKVDFNRAHPHNNSAIAMSNSAIATLAPAAGAGIGKMVADLLLIDGSYAAEVAEAFRRGLRAKVRRWDQALKDWIVDDDCRTQLQAAALSLAHMEGEPIKRVIHQHLGTTGEINLQAAVAESPQLQEQLKRLLENATFRQTAGHRPTTGTGRRTKAVKPAELEVVEFE